MRSGLGRRTWLVVGLLVGAVACTPAQMQSWLDYNGLPSFSSRAELAAGRGGDVEVAVGDLGVAVTVGRAAETPEKPRRESSPDMTMTDPIADMLTRLRNANMAYHDTVAMPHSKLKTHVAEILQQEGYIAGWHVDEPGEGEVGKTLTLELKYGPNRERSIAGIKRISKPGLRVYAKSTNLPRVLGGLGVAIISTSSGLLTDRQAGKKGVGGEVLAYVW